MEENYDENRNHDDVKLISSLKRKMKVLKTAYLEEHEKALTLKNQFDELVLQKQNLEEALSKKETICAKLNAEIQILKDNQTTIKSYSENYIRSNKESELGSKLQNTLKENDELKKQLELLKQNLTINENAIAVIQAEFSARIQELTSEINAGKIMLIELGKERDEAKENAVKCEELTRINFDQRA